MENRKSGEWSVNLTINLFVSNSNSKLKDLRFVKIN